MQRAAGRNTYFRFSETATVGHDPRSHDAFCEDRAEEVLQAWRETEGDRIVRR